jgi:2-polyprenyl-3-methyl-5-hydroxy-6-metoxy-1,4-benzoquinol methylase
MTETKLSHCPACGKSLGGQTVDHLGYQLHTCSSCGLWFWNDRTPPDYDAVYGTAEYEVVQVNPFTTDCDPAAFRNHATYAAFFREAPQIQGGKLLDVGCGVGRFLVAARAESWNVRGIDVSQVAVDIGRNGAGLDLSCASLEELAAQGERFQAVTSFEVLEHVERPIDFVRSVFQVVEAGSYFFCTVPNRKSPTVRKTRRADWLPPIHLQFYTDDALRQLLQRAGGVNVRTGFIHNTTPPRLLRGKVKQLLRRIATGSPYDPLGIWGYAERDNV